MNFCKALLIVFISLNFSAFVCSAMIDESIVPNSSYYICETIGEMPGTLRHVIFYTFDGEPIERLEYHVGYPSQHYFSMKNKLDKSAPLPRPVRYYFIDQPPIQLGFGFTKGVAGTVVVFLDKNGHKIDIRRYNKNEGLQVHSSELDLSIAQEAIELNITESSLVKKSIFNCVIS